VGWERRLRKIALSAKREKLTVLKGTHNGVQQRDLKNAQATFSISHWANPLRNTDLAMIDGPQ
jgi:hypothetical protein